MSKLEENEETEFKSTEKSSWIKVKPAELEKLIVDLHKQGNSPAKIGLILRDKHAIPKARLLGKKITKVLKEAKVQYVSDKDIVNEKIEGIKSHLEKNKYDYTAKKSLSKRMWILYNLNKFQ